MHAPQGMWGIAGAVLAGLLLGALFLAFGSIVVAIVAHYVVNTAQIAQLVRARAAAAHRVPHSAQGGDHPLDGA
jgi:membrane protease YdiL (CAAX protease family)